MNVKEINDKGLAALFPKPQAVFIRDASDEFARKNGYYPHEQDNELTRQFFTENPNELLKAPFYDYDDIDKFKKDDEYAQERSKHYLSGKSFMDSSKLAHDFILNKYGGK